MPTFTAFTTIAGETAAKNLGEAMEELAIEPYGVGVFEIEDGSGLWEVGGYFADAPDGIVLELLAAAHGARGFVVSELPDVDWVAKVQRELHPVEAGRFFLYGSHDGDKVPADRIPLLIEATMAFGTGHHDTTSGCLLAFDALYTAGFRPHRVADIGAGTAVLALAAAKVLPDAQIIASDIDPVAVEVARANLAINGAETRIECIEAAGFDHPRLETLAPFDLVFANILMPPLLALADDMAAHVAVGGRAILSGLLLEQAAAIIRTYSAAGFRLESQNDRCEWTTLVMIRE